jgi:hypothetical protein
MEEIPQTKIALNSNSQGVSKLFESREWVVT